MYQRIILATLLLILSHRELIEEERERERERERKRIRETKGKILYWKVLLRRISLLKYRVSQNIEVDFIIRH